MMGEALATCNTVLTDARDLLDRQVQTLVPCTCRWYALGAMLRKLLVGAFVVGVSFTLASFLCLAAGSPAWAQVERKNCPGDFHWERMSGQCCVQDYETIPEHGRIGYTGNSICDDGYVGVYQRRPTTGGGGPPGCPGYTSFAFLTSCVRSGSGTGATAGGGLDSGGAIRDLSDALYDRGSGPSPGDLAAVGGLSIGVLVLSGGTVVVLRRRPISPEEASQRFLARQHRDDLRGEIQAARREEQAALEELERVRDREWRLKRQKWDIQDELKRLIDDLQRLEGELSIGGKAVSLTGVISILASLLGPEGTAASIFASAVGIVGGEDLAASDCRAAIAQRIAEVEARLREADENIRKYDRAVQIAEDRVKDNRGRVDGLEGQYGRDYGDLNLPPRQRPLVGKEYTFDDWLSGRRRW